MAHVLFIDMVGYSQLPMNRAKALVAKFQQTVQKSAEYTRAKARDELIFRPTGDGGAIVFLGNPEAPVRCAIELHKEFSKDQDLKVRMGVHSGPCMWSRDLSSRAISMYWETALIWRSASWTAAMPAIS